MPLVYSVESRANTRPFLYSLRPLPPLSPLPSQSTTLFARPTMTTTLPAKSAVVFRDIPPPERFRFVLRMLSLICILEELPGLFALL